MLYSFLLFIQTFVVFYVIFAFFAYFALNKDSFLLFFINEIVEPGKSFLVLVDRQRNLVLNFSKLLFKLFHLRILLSNRAAIFDILPLNLERVH